MTRARKAPILFFFFAATAVSASNHIYVAQNAQGGNTGVDCANAKAYSYFNTSSSWGTGSTLIGPGTTVHICGTITLGNGANFFTFQGSGASGNPVTLKWEDGAILQAPYMSASGGIVASSRTYLVLDGGTNGIIRNTRNGTSGAACPGGACNSQQGSVGVYFSNTTNITIKNLEIGPIYYRVSNDSSSGAGTCAYMNNQSHSGASNFLFQSNKIHDCQDGVFDYYGTTDGSIEVDSNEIYRINGGYKPGQGPGTGSLNGFYFHDNDVHDWDNWDDMSLGYNNHHDTIQVYGGTGLSNCYVWNNYFHGNFGLGTTPGVYLDNTGTGTYTCTVFNNVFNILSSGDGGDGAFTPQNEGGGPVTLNAYNNTLIASGVALTGFWFSGSGVKGDIRNNIISGWNFGLYVTNGASLPTTSNYNLWSHAGGALFRNGSTDYTTLSSWRSATGLDGSSSSADSLVDSAFKPLAGSPAIGTGQNLTSLCTGVLTALCTDKAGIARPASGPWAIGAYEAGSGTPPGTITVLPPTGVTAHVF